MKVTPETLTAEMVRDAVTRGLVSEAFYRMSTSEPADSPWRTVAREMICDAINARGGE